MYLSHTFLQVRHLRLVEVQDAVVELPQTPQEHGSRRGDIHGGAGAPPCTRTIVHVQQVFTTLKHARQVRNKIAHFCALHQELVALSSRVRIELLSLQKAQVLAIAREFENGL